MLEPNLFNSIFVFPIVNILVLLYKGFLFLKIPGAFGLAIIGLTVLIRLLLHPFFKQQLEMAKKMQELKPHLDRLSKKHKNDKKRLQEEQLKLYQQAGINPASSCLLMLLQFPIFIALYNTLSLFLINGKEKEIINQINKVLYTPLLKISSIDPQFFGFNLALSPAKAGQWHYLLIPFLTGFLQYFQTQSTMPRSQEGNIEKTSKQKDNKEDASDFQKAMSTQMKFIFPIMIGWFSYSLPVGLSLYWNVFSLFSIIQQRKLKVKNFTDKNGKN